MGCLSRTRFELIKFSKKKKVKTAYGALKKGVFYFFFVFSRFFFLSICCCCLFNGLFSSLFSLRKIIKKNIFHFLLYFFISSSWVCIRVCILDACVCVCIRIIGVFGILLENGYLDWINFCIFNDLLFFYVFFYLKSTNIDYWFSLTHESEGGREMKFICFSTGWFLYDCFP